MKRLAFLQALIVVILLTGSWIIFLKRSKDSPQESNEVPVAEEVVQEALPEVTIEVVKEPAPEIKNVAAVPPQWKEWIDYLLAQESAPEMRTAILALREAIFSMDATDGSARLIELIISGIDFETGLGFQVGKGGNLVGAPTFQSNLVDWLGQIDPVRAAGIARLALNGAGTRLGPDLFVLHLRNFARGTPQDQPESSSFLRKNFEMLLSNEEWIRNPTSSIAESMDIAVYLAQPDLVPELARLAGPDQSGTLRHASSLALERIIDQDAPAAISLMLNTPEGQAMLPESRAGFVARLDPVDPDSKALLTTYLNPTRTSAEEAALFLQHFPNLNRSLSHNLLSDNIPITESAHHMDRLQRALEEVRSWQTDPELASLMEVLGETEVRLNSQMTGSPAP